jgi:hypothetical protein
VPLTPPGDLYFALNDSLFPKVFAAIKQQRPSLLNYATPYFAKHPGDWCLAIPNPANGAPKFTAISAVQVLTGSPAPPVEFMIQISDIEVGFGVDTVGLPPELLPLPAQRVVLKVSLTARFAVPQLDPTTVGCPTTNQFFAHADFPLKMCDCFAVTFFSIATAWIMPCGATNWIAFALEKFYTPNFTPPGLRETLGYLVTLLLDTSVLPRFWVKVAPFVLDLSKALPPAAPIKSITITPTSPTPAPNPDIAGHVSAVKFKLKVTAP